VTSKHDSARSEIVSKANMNGVTLLLDESLLEEYFSTTRVASRKQLIRTNSNQSQKGPSFHPTKKGQPRPEAELHI
jgi:hypothetical protein